MRAGANRQSMVLMGRSSTSDLEGEVSWADVMTVRADIQSLQGRDVVDGGHIVDYLVTIRFIPSGLPPEPRLRWKGRVFDVRSSIDPDNRRRELQLACVELITN